MSEDRFVTPYPPPTPYEREIIEILIEECAEVQQRGTKMLRFGVREVQPGQSLTNTARLAHEVGDLLEIIDLAVNAGLMDPRDIEAGRVHKRAQLKKYMQHDAGV